MRVSWRWTGPAATKPGLGTGIIEALTRQLDAQIEVDDAKPGTAVSIMHTGTAQIAKPIPSRAAAV
jgi:two-component sensor histidine kinase